MEKEDVNEAMRLMEMSKDSLQADKSSTARLAFQTNDWFRSALTCIQGLAGFHPIQSPFMRLLRL